MRCACGRHETASQDPNPVAPVTPGINDHAACWRPHLADAQQESSRPMSIEIWRRLWLLDKLRQTGCAISPRASSRESQHIEIQKHPAPPTSWARQPTTLLHTTATCDSAPRAKYISRKSKNLSWTTRPALKSWTISSVPTDRGSSGNDQKPARLAIEVAAQPLRGTTAGPQQGTRAARWGTRRKALQSPG
jgi:hypothetical protein